MECMTNHYLFYENSLLLDEGQFFSDNCTWSDFIWFFCIEFDTNQFLILHKSNFLRQQVYNDCEIRVQLWKTSEISCSKSGTVNIEFCQVQGPETSRKLKNRIFCFRPTTVQAKPDRIRNIYPVFGPFSYFMSRLPMRNDFRKKKN